MLVTVPSRSISQRSRDLLQQWCGRSRHCCANFRLRCGGLLRSRPIHMLAGRTTAELQARIAARSGKMSGRAQLFIPRCQILLRSHTGRRRSESLRPQRRLQQSNTGQQRARTTVFTCVPPTVASRRLQHVLLLPAPLHPRRRSLGSTPRPYKPRLWLDRRRISGRLRRLHQPCSR